MKKQSLNLICAGLTLTLCLQSHGSRWSSDDSNTENQNNQKKTLNISADKFDSVTFTGKSGEACQLWDRTENTGGKACSDEEIFEAKQTAQNFVRDQNAVAGGAGVVAVGFCVVGAAVGTYIGSQIHEEIKTVGHANLIKNLGKSVGAAVGINALGFAGFAIVLPLLGGPPLTVGGAHFLLKSANLITVTCGVGAGVLTIIVKNQLQK